MNNEKLINQLLEAIEHPEHYTEEQLQNLLKSEEARQYYQLIADVSSAHSYEKNKGKLTDDMLDSEWQKLQKPQPSRSHRRYRVAAAVSAILLMSGIALAAIHFVRVNHRQSVGETSITTMPQPDGKPQKTPSSTDATAPLLPIKDKSPRQFDNVPLGEIVTEMGLFYGVRTTFHSEEAAGLRLRYLWDRSQPVEIAVETLNKFDKVDVTFTNSVIVIQ